MTEENREAESFDDEEAEYHRWHVYPVFGKEHDCSTDCWCRPTLHYQNPLTGDQVWEHHVHH